MTKKLAVIVALALLIVGIAAPSASAVCNPPKFASTYNSGTGAYTYWHSTIAGGTLRGQMWSGSTDYTGTCNETGHFLYFGADPHDVGLNVSLGDGCSPGCPSDSLSIKVTISAASGSSQEFVATSSPETPLGAVNFDFSANAHDMVRTPRPRVASTYRIYSNIFLTTYPEPLSGWYEGTASQVTGCNIRGVLATTDPGRNASAYPTLLATVPVSGGTCQSANFPVDCSAYGPNQWLVYQLVTAAGADPLVGQATRLNCNPALADPKPRVDPKKPRIDNKRQ